jgi:hypothetical protein
MPMIKTAFKRLWLSYRKVKDNPSDCIVCNAFLLNPVKYLWDRPDINSSRQLLCRLIDLDSMIIPYRMKNVNILHVTTVY